MWTSSIVMSWFYLYDIEIPKVSHTISKAMVVNIFH